MVGGLEEQGEQLGGAGQPPERQRAELVAADLGRGLGAQLGAAGQHVGDPVQHRVHPDRVAGLDPGDHQPQPVLVAARQGHVPAAALLLEPRPVRGPVDLDHLGLGQLDHLRRRLPHDRLGHRGVHHRRRCRRQPTGQHRDLAGHPHLGPQRPHLRPGQRQPVPQVERVRHQRPGGQRVHPAGDAELGEAQVLHQWGALPADLDQPVPTRGEPPPALGAQPRVGGVQVGPVRGQPQVVDLGRPAAEQHLVDQGQGPGRIELVEGYRHAHSLLEQTFD